MILFRFIARVFLLSVILFSISACSDNLFDPLSPDSAGLPLVRSAKSLTEEGDAFFASGDLDAAKNSYEKALDKDGSYGPAIVGLVAIDLQIMVRTEFPGKETFTAAVLPLLYQPMTSLGSSSSGGALSFASIENDPNVVDIRSRTNMLSVIRSSLDKLFQIKNPSSGIVINMTVLLAIDVIDRIFPLLDAVESMETLAIELADGGATFTSTLGQFSSFNPMDYLDLSWTPVDLMVNSGATGTVTVETSRFDAKITELRNAYQRIYYLYYFFQNQVTTVETQLRELNSSLSRYTAAASSIHDSIISDIYTTISDIQTQVADITAQIDQSSQYITDFTTGLATIKNLESSLDSTVFAGTITTFINTSFPSHGTITAISFTPTDLDAANMDLTMCGGITVDNSGTPTVLGSGIGVSQLDAGVELGVLPIISDDPAAPCTGTNPRFQQ